MVQPVVLWCLADTQDGSFSVASVLLDFAAACPAVFVQGACCKFNYVDTRHYDT